MQVLKRRYNRRRYAIFKRDANHYFAIDMYYARLKRCRERLGYWATAVRDLGEFGSDYIFIGLGVTYDYLGTIKSKGQKWEPLDISKLMEKIKKELGEKLIAYAWVGEVQENGNPHYHVLLVCKKGAYIQFPDKSGLWNKGSSNVTRRVRSPGYLVRYAGKAYQKDFDLYPPGMRLFCIWIKDRALTRRVRWQSLSAVEKIIVEDLGWMSYRWIKVYKPYYSHAPPCEYVGSLTPKKFEEFVYQMGERLRFDFEYEKGLVKDNEVRRFIYKSANELQ